MSLDGRIRYSNVLHATIYEETEASRNSARGLGETSCVGVHFTSYDGDIVKLTIGETVYFVPRSVLKAAARL